MNITLGVDGKEKPKTSSAAASLLRRLRFPNASIDVVHVLTRMPYKLTDRNVTLSGEALEAVKHASLEWAQDLVSQIANQFRMGALVLSGDAPPPIVKVLVRRSVSVAGGLLAQAGKKNADLIAVDGPHQGEIGAFLTGSTARSLVIGSHQHSLLLAKNYGPAALGATRPAQSSSEPTSDENHRRIPNAKDFGPMSRDRPVRAVLATDHSPYANRCLETLIQLAPRGISHLVLLTALSDAAVIDIGSSRPNPAHNTTSAIGESLLADNDAGLRRLAPLLEATGTTSESRVIEGSVNDAITQTMKETKADLLILGAHGHGLMDRLTLGSVAFHQAMTAPYSILILRA